MKFWVLARGEKFEEQLLVSAESTDDLRTCLESLLNVTIRQMSITDFQAQVVEKLLLQQQGGCGSADIIHVNLRTQQAAGSSTGLSKGSEGSAGSSEGGPLMGFPGGYASSGDDQPPVSNLSRTNSQSKLTIGAGPAPVARGASQTASTASGSAPVIVSTSRRGSGTASELFNADMMLPIDRICLTRESMTTLLSTTFRGNFHHVVKGCFVRVRGASSLATSASGYAVVQVVSVVSDTQVGLDLVHVVEVRHLDVVSNSPPTADEVRMWAKHMLHAGRSAVTSAFIEAKLSDINDALRTASSALAPSSDDDVIAHSVRTREPTSLSAPWEESLTTDDGVPLPPGGLINLEECTPPHPAAGGSGGKLRRRQTMLLHPQNFLQPASQSGPDSNSTNMGSDGADGTSPAKSMFGAPPSSKGNSPTHAGGALSGQAGTSPSHHSSSALLRAHLAINKAAEAASSTTVSDDGGSSVIAPASAMLPTAGGSSKSLIKQRLDSISQAISQQQQRMTSSPQQQIYAPPPSAPPDVTTNSPTTNNESPQGGTSTATLAANPAVSQKRASSATPSTPTNSGRKFADGTPPQSTGCQKRAAGPAASQPGAPPLAPAPVSVVCRSVVSLNDTLLNGWLLQHAVEDGSFEYLLFGTRQSNPKARRSRVSDYAGCCISLVDEDIEDPEESCEPPKDRDALSSRGGKQLFHETLRLTTDVDRDVTVKGFLVHCAPQLFRGTFVALASYAKDHIEHKGVCGSERESPGTSPHRPAVGDDSVSVASSAGTVSVTVSVAGAPTLGAPTEWRNAYEFLVLSGRDVTSLYNPPYKTYLPIPSWGAPMSSPHAVLRPQLVFASSALHVFYLVALAQPLIAEPAEGASSHHHHGTHPKVHAPPLLYGLAHAVCQDGRLSQWTLLTPKEPIVQQAQQPLCSTVVPLFSVCAGCIPQQCNNHSTADADKQIVEGDGLTLMWCEPRMPDVQPTHPPPTTGSRFRASSATRVAPGEDGPHMPTPPHRSQSPPPVDAAGPPAPLSLHHVTPPRRSASTNATLAERPAFDIRVLVNVDDAYRSGAWAPHECTVPDLSSVLARPLEERFGSVLDDMTRHVAGIRCMSLVQRRHRYQHCLDSSGVKIAEVDNALMIVIGEDRHHRAAALLLPAKVV